MHSLSLRRAALRLFSSSPAATSISTAATARQRSVTTLYRYRSSYLFPRGSSPQEQCALQRRWNSDEAAGRWTDLGYENENENGNGDEKYKDKDNREGASVKITTEGPGNEVLKGQAQTEAQREEVGAAAEAGVETEEGTEVDATTPESVLAEEEAGKNSAAPTAGDPAASQKSKFRYVEAGASPKETVFVSNLFFDVTPDDLRTQMENYGVVHNVVIVHDNRGISKGFGYVTFDTLDSATRAIDQMDGTMYEGRPVFVQYARANTLDYQLRTPTKPPSRTIYVSKIPPQMTAKELHDLFDDCTNVIDIRVSVDRRTGQLRGFAHAEFLNVESAKAGLAILGGKKPYGKPLKLDYSHTNRKLGERQSALVSGYEVPIYNGPSSSSSSS